MNIIDHGKWEAYTPIKPYKAFEGTGLNVAYARRISDGKDWYAFAYDDKPFRHDSVKMIVHFQENAWIVGAAVYDPTRLFPQKAILLEITDYTGNDPQVDFSGKIYDLNTEEFKMRPPVLSPEIRIQNTLNDIMARLDKLESGK